MGASRHRTTRCAGAAARDRVIRGGVIRDSTIRCTGGTRNAGVPVPVLMLPFVDPSLVACATAARTERPAIRQARTRTGWVQPVVLKEVRPAYTYDAMKQRAEGAAWVKAVVTSAGCISEVEIVRSLHPHLDVMALRAVSQWRFRPARLDDVPAPVQIVVESKFSMK